MSHTPAAHSDHEGMAAAPVHVGTGPHVGHAGPARHMDHAGHGGHVGHGGHGGHGHHVAQFRRLFWLMLVLATPVVGFSSMFASLIGYGLPTAGWTTWISPVLGSLMYVFGGRPFLTGGKAEVRARRPGMMLLFALALTVALVSSWGASLSIVGHHLDFWWELALLIVIMLAGHWIEMRSLAQTTSALDSLAALLPDEAERVEGDRTVRVHPTELRVGDVVVVRPGASIPADGRIAGGAAAVDESMITGESATVRRGVGARVVAGTVVTDSGLRIEVTAVGDDTALAGIGRLVAEAQSSSSRARRIADVAAGWLFWFAFGAAAVTAVVWALILHGPDDAVTRTITVLVIACPHARSGHTARGLDRHRTRRSCRRARSGRLRASHVGRGDPHVAVHDRGRPERAAAAKDRPPARRSCQVGRTVLVKNTRWKPSWVARWVSW